MTANLIDSIIKKNLELHKEFSRIYKFIGSGKFMASYYDKEKDVVYKVFKLSVLKNHEHSNRVSEYPEFIFDFILNKPDSKQIGLLISNLWKNNYQWPLFCMKNKDKYTHVPKVYEFFHYPEAFGFAYSTEPLVSIKKYSANKLDYRFIDGINTCFYNRHHNENDFFDHFSPVDFSMTQEAYIKRLEYVNVKELKKLSNAIYKKFKDNEIDLHSKNFMFREKDNLLIINDPLY